MPIFGVDTTIVQKFTPIVFEFLESKGFKIRDRDQYRLTLHCRAVCLYEAISRVYFTDDHYAAGTPFDYGQLIDMLGYLTVTREQFWFALSHVFPSMVNPHLTMVMTVIKKMIEEKNVEETWFAKHKSLANSKGVPDYNTYFFDACPLKNGAVKDASSIEVASSLLMKRIASDGLVVLSEENIQDVLHSLLGHTQVCKKYTSQHVQSDDQNIRVDILREKRGIEGGLEISRVFMDSVIDKDYTKIMEECMQHIMTEPNLVMFESPSTPHDEQNTATFRTQPVTRVVLGYSLRTPKSQSATFPPVDKCCPQLLKCMDLIPRTEPLRVSNDAYRRIGHSVLVHGQRLREQRRVPRTMPVTHMDRNAIRKWHKRTGYVIPTVNHEKKPVFFMCTARQASVSEGDISVPLGGQEEVKRYPEHFLDPEEDETSYDNIMRNEEDGEEEDEEDDVIMSIPLPPRPCSIGTDMSPEETGRTDTTSKKRTGEEMEGRGPPEQDGYTSTSKKKKRVQLSLGDSQ
jgi:hypothetical protein